MKFGICNEIFQDWDLAAVFEYVAGLGYHGVELAPFTLARTVNEVSLAQRQQIRDLAARFNLEVCGLHWLLAKTEGLHLSHPDAEVRQRTSTYLRDLVNCCGDVGGRVLVLGSPQQRNILDGVSAEQAWNFAAETLRPAIQRAGERSVTLCIEPLAASETNFLNRAADAIRFAEQFHSASAKIILDVKAMSAESMPVPQIIQASGPHLAHFHANDPNLGGPGFGAVDFHPIAAALRAVNYNGFVSVEVFRFDEGPRAIAERSLNYLKQCFSDPPPQQ